MKKENISIAIVAFILGEAVSYGISSYDNSRGLKSSDSKSKVKDFLNDFFNEKHFLQNNDPFDEIQKFRKYWRKNLDELYGNSIFEDWYSDRFGGNMGEISKTEDSKTVSYKIVVPGLNNGKVNVKVNNGQVIIDGTIEEIQKNMVTKTIFKRVFPIVHYVDTSNIDVKVNEDTIVLKFIKTKEPLNNLNNLNNEDKMDIVL
ncbi:MAG: hypothetical protein HQK51_18715 [Oligoflexia bacterium]|nr:hypothetical protein [Oligoflexia bacterium]